MEIYNFCRFIEDIEILFFYKCLLSSTPRFRQLLSKSLYSFGHYSNVKGKFSKKIFKNFLLKSCKADEAVTLHTCSSHDISLYKVCVFYCPCPTTLVAMAT